MDPYFLKRLWRRPWLSLCSLILSGTLCFLLCFLSGYRQEQQRKLKETQESFEVLCVVSNVKGTQTTGLRLWSWASQFVTSEESALHPYVKDLRMTKEYEADCLALGITGARLLGVTNERCADALNPAMGGGVTYLEDGFYDSERMCCLVSEAVFSQLDGETEITLSVTDPMINRKLEPDMGVGQISFRVAGYYAGKGTELYMPFRASQKLGLEISGRTGVDSIAFLAADNTALTELSNAASEKFSTVDPLTSEEESSVSAALTIHDEQYRMTVATLERNIQRTSYLLPVLLLLGLGLGFLISFLSTRNERRTYALMRTLGLTRGKLFFSILREQLTLAAVACCLVLAVTGAVLPAALYMICYSVGCVLCTGRTIQAPPTAILREQE